MIKKVIEIPLYKNRLGIILTDDSTIGEVYSFFDQQGMMNNNFKLECGSTINGWYKEDNGISYKCTYIVLNFSDDELTHGTITHEILHFVNFIFTEIGAKIDQLNDEPQAYLAGWATNCVYSFMEEEGKIIKNNIL